jgi:hypothetical protein
MTVTRRSANYLVLGIAAVLAACTTQMEPAKKAIDDISSTIEAASAEADKYIPDQVASVDRKLTDLYASFDKKDYAAVLAGAPAVLSEAQGLAAATAAKKDEIMKSQTSEWSGLSASVPQLVRAVKTRVDALAKTRHVPKGVDLAAAKSGLGDATVLWDKAQAAFQSNHVADAVTAAKDAKAKAEAAAAALKIN